MRFPMVLDQKYLYIQVLNASRNDCILLPPSLASVCFLGTLQQGTSGFHIVHKETKIKGAISFFDCEVWLTFLEY